MQLLKDGRVLWRAMCEPSCFEPVGDNTDVH